MTSPTWNEPSWSSCCCAGTECRLRCRRPAAGLQRRRSRRQRGRVGGVQSKRLTRGSTEPWTRVVVLAVFSRNDSPKSSTEARGRGGTCKLTRRGQQRWTGTHQGKHRTVDAVRRVGGVQSKRLTRGSTKAWTRVVVLAVFSRRGDRLASTVFIVVLAAVDFSDRRQTPPRSGRRRSGSARRCVGAAMNLGLLEAAVDFSTCLVVAPFTVFIELRRYHVGVDFVCKLYQVSRSFRRVAEKLLLL